MEIFDAASKQTVASMSVKPDAGTVAPRAVERSEQSVQQTRPDGNEQEVDTEKLKSIAENLNDQMKTLNSDIKFGYNDKINTMYISVYEQSTGKTIRKIPSEEAMRLDRKSVV